MLVTDYCRHVFDEYSRIEVIGQLMGEINSDNRPSTLVIMAITGFIMACVAVLIVVPMTHTFISDDWSLAEALFTEPIHTLGELMVRIWIPHNGHRHVIPKLIMGLNGWWFPFSTLRMGLLSLLFSGLGFWCLKDGLFATSARRGANTVLLVILALFYFSLGQKSNWNISMYVLWPLSGLGFIGFCQALASNRTGWAVFWFFIVYLTALSWVALVPTWFVFRFFKFQTDGQIKNSSKQQFNRITVGAHFAKSIVTDPWSYAFVVLGFVYFYGAHATATRSGGFQILPWLGLTIQIIGSPFQWIDEKIAWFMGLALVLLLPFICTLNERTSKTKKEAQSFSNHFFIYITISALLFAMITAFGRYGLWAWSDNVPDRYSTLIIPMWILAVPKIIDWAADRLKNPFRQCVQIATVTILILQFTITTAKSLRHERWLQQEQTLGDKCLQRYLGLGNPSESVSEPIDVLATQKCTHLIYPDFEVLVAVAARLHSVGIYPLK